LIARQKGDGAEGVYHHSDGYPAGLGCYLFRLLRHKFKGDVEAFLGYVLSHDGGWSHIYPSVVVKRGKNGGQAFEMDESKYRPQCYCHGYFAQRDGIKPGDKSGWRETNLDEVGEDWDLEWAYVFADYTMSVWKAERVWDKRGPDGKPQGKWVCKAIIDTRGPEPSWVAIQGYGEGKAWPDAYFPPVTEPLGVAA
jgi:hypothetical protein